MRRPVSPSRRPPVLRPRGAARPRGGRLSARVLAVVAAAASASAAGCEAPPPGGDATEAGAAAAEGVHRQVRRLGEGVYAYEYAPDGDPVTTVSLVVVGRDGVLVADGQGSPEETERLLAAVRERTTAPVTHLVVASDHGDHTGGNAAFPEGVEVLAHPAAVGALEAAAADTGRAPGAPPVVLPTRPVEDEAAVSLGDREVRVLFLGRGHTAGDLAVHVPDAGVLFLSEAHQDRVFPLLRSGYPSEWVRVLEEAEAMDVETYVAGHGVRGSIDTSREGLVRHRRALERIISEARRLHGQGVAADEAVDSAQLGELLELADYEPQMPRAIRRVYAELEGSLP